MKVLIFLILTLITSFAEAQNLSELKYCQTPEKIGIGGFDPVSYFKSPTPLEGKPTIMTTYDGVNYQFVSQENRKEFLRSPTRYLPQFGGWCSMTLAMGRATTPIYDNFLIQDGKLFLFERTLAVNGKELWLKNPSVNTEKASVTYKKFIAAERPK